MGQRVRAVALVAVLLLVGALAGSAVSQWRGGAAEGGEAPARTAAPRAGAPDQRVRVEVLNGGGRANMARRATERLRDRGFDVVYYGNADTFDRDTTVVVDRVGRPAWAAAVAGALGGEAVSVVSEADTTRFVDVSVVLGASWDPGVEPSTGPVPPPVPASRPAWWDLRRFLPRGDGGVPTRPGAPGRMADPANEGG